uniref:Uncharacterized protein n=1 Tax=Rheinheimera sp. BAL341 TaxID=1708203 RepID=A0A486XLS1_9GAMM
MQARGQLDITQRRLLPIFLTRAPQPGILSFKIASLGL